MHPKYRALIWEQFRIYREIFLLVYIFTLPLCLGFYYSIQADNLFSRVILDLFPFVLMPMYLFTLLLLGPMSSNKRGRIDDFFDPRLLLLPVPTFTLVLVVFLSRLLCLISMYLLVYMTTRMTLGNSLPASYFLVPMLIYICLQAGLWAGNTIRSFLYVAGIGSVVFFFFRPSFLLHLIELYSESISLKSVFSGVFISTAAFVVAWLGVHYQRIEQYANGFSIRDIQLWLNGLYAPPARKFSSPMEAQLWFERRHIGRLLPVSFFVLMLIGMVALWPIIDMTGVLSKYYFFLALASLFTGFSVLAKSRSAYMFLRPISTGNIARAKMYTVARSLFFILCLAPLFTLADMYLIADKGYLLSHAWQDSVIDSIRLASLFIKPVLTAGVVAWICLWLRSWIAIPTLLLLSGINSCAGTNSLIAEADGLTIPLPNFDPNAFWSIIIVCVISLSAVMTAWWKEVIPRTHLLLVICGWAILALVMHYMPFSPRIPGEMVLYVAFLIALVHLPFTAIPITLWGQRVGEKGPYI